MKELELQKEFGLVGRIWDMSHDDILIEMFGEEWIRDISAAFFPNEARELKNIFEEKLNDQTRTSQR